MTKLQAFLIGVVFYIIYAIIVAATGGGWIGWVFGGLVLALAAGVIFDSNKEEES